MVNISRYFQSITTQMVYILVLNFFYLLVHCDYSTAQQYDFVFKMNNVFDKEAEKHVIEKNDVEIYRESFGDKVSYWGIEEGKKSGQMTFRFDFEKPLEYGRIKANLIGSNFKLNQSTGNGKGWGSLWYSTNGLEWRLLEDCPVQEKQLVSSNYFIRFLPDDLQGKKSLWLQVRLSSDVNQIKAYCVAQFCRNETNDPESMVFDLRVKYKK